MVNSLKVIFATLVIFAAGVISGGLMFRQMQGVKASSAPPAPVVTTNVAAAVHAQRLDLLKRMSHQLTLSSEQKEHIEKIMQESQEHMKAFRDDLSVKTRDEIKHAREQVRAELSREQRRKFDELLRNRVQRPEENGRRRPNASPTNSTGETPPRSPE
jgi:hypothetical protein